MMCLKTSRCPALREEQVLLCHLLPFLVKPVADVICINNGLRYLYILINLIDGSIAKDNYGVEGYGSLHAENE